MTYRIVVGMDGSAYGAAALRWAMAEAAVRSGQVTAVFAWQMPLVSIPGAFDRDEMDRAAQRFLIEQVALALPGTEPTVRLLVAEGDPVDSLTTAAEDADLLVLGSRGRSHRRRLMLGAVAQGCAVYARCPVVLVRPDEDD